MIDKHGGRDVLAATNLVFAAGLVCLSFASGIGSLAFAWALIGIGMGFGLYEAAFATAAGLYGREARNAITGITLFAGFASTVGWPTSALFIEHFGWRGACVAWAVLHLVIGLPMNRLLIPKAVPHLPETTAAACAAPPDSLDDDRARCRVRRDLVRLDCLGRPSAAAPGSNGIARQPWRSSPPRSWVLRRSRRVWLNSRCSERLSPMISARLATGLHPIGALLLAIFGPVMAVPFVLLHGAGNGMLTIARGTLPLALFGPAGYGMRTGILSAPARILQGGAPLLFGVVLDSGGPLLALLLTGSLTGLSFLALFTLSRPTPRRNEGRAPLIVRPTGIPRRAPPQYR